MNKKLPVYDAALSPVSPVKVGVEALQESKYISYKKHWLLTHPKL